MSIAMELDDSENHALQQADGLNINAQPWGGTGSANGNSLQRRQHQSEGNLYMEEPAPPPLHSYPSGSSSHPNLLFLADGAGNSAASLSPPQTSPQIQATPTDKRPMCKYHQFGGCNKGADCPFSHDLTVEAPEGVDASGGFILNTNVRNAHASPKEGSQPQHYPPHSATLPHGRGFPSYSPHTQNQPQFPGHGTHWTSSTPHEGAGSPGGFEAGWNQQQAGQHPAHTQGTITTNAQFLHSPIASGPPGGLSGNGPPFTKINTSGNIFPKGAEGYNQYTEVQQSVQQQQGGQGDQLAELAQRYGITNSGGGNSNANQTSAQPSNEGMRFTFYPSSRSSQSTLSTNKQLRQQQAQAQGQFTNTGPPPLTALDTAGAYPNMQNFYAGQNNTTNAANRPPGQEGLFPQAQQPPHPSTTGAALDPTLYPPLGGTAAIPSQLQNMYTKQQQQPSVDGAATLTKESLSSSDLFPPLPGGSPSNLKQQSGSVGGHLETGSNSDDSNQQRQGILATPPKTLAYTATSTNAIYTNSQQTFGLSNAPSTATQQGQGGKAPSSGQPTPEANISYAMVAASSHEVPSSSTGAKQPQQAPPRQVDLSKVPKVPLSIDDELHAMQTMAFKQQHPEGMSSPKTSSSPTGAPVTAPIQTASSKTSTVGGTVQAGKSVSTPGGKVVSGKTQPASRQPASKGGRGAGGNQVKRKVEPPTNAPIPL